MHREKGKLIVICQFVLIFRKRVNLILHSQAFRDELEQLVEQQIKSGGSESSIRALQQLSELLIPQYRYNQSSNMSRGISLLDL